MTTPCTPVLSQSLQLSPGVASFFDVCFQIAAPIFPFPSGFQVKACRVTLSTGLRRSCCFAIFELYDCFPDFFFPRHSISAGRGKLVGCPLDPLALMVCSEAPRSIPPIYFFVLLRQSRPYIFVFYVSLRFVNYSRELFCGSSRFMY